MTIQETQANAAVTVTTPSARLFAPETFYYTFVRATKSELHKLTASIAFWLTGGAAVLIAFGIGAMWMALAEMFGEGSVGKFDPSFVTGTWDTYALFLIPLGVLAVSSEYSRNTMRTTVLSVPSRPIAFAAKMTAIFIYCGTLALAIILANFASVMIFVDTTGFVPHSLRALFVCWLVLTTFALGSAGLAYLMRSTALPIVLLIVILEFVSIVALVPNETVREIASTVLPTYVGHTAMQSGSDSIITIMLGIDNDLSWGEALAIWLGYMAALVAGGFARFVKSDV
ncbi:MAG: hypothetical protein IKS49_03130 [Actinomycetaceae bacterium]|nr:hypothetical protein [Actinomycetaceae bacterium]